jgi:integrase/recombinase XerD
MTKPFQSRWASQLGAFVEFKHALGQTYFRPLETLRSFDRFAASPPWRRSSDFAAIFKGWLNQYSDRKATTVRSYLGSMRQFCLFRRRNDPDAFMPDCSWAGRFQRSRFLPHIFSPKEIRQILAAISQLRASPRDRQRYRLLFIVLYCTGLRLGEALGIRRRDVDQRNGSFRVGPSKGRIRCVPFRRDLGRELRRLLEQDGQDCSPGAFVFAKGDGGRRCVISTSTTFRAVFRRCGLKPMAGRTGPRVHDLRHTMAVHCLQRWYREGRDLPRMIPWLSAYLGHRDLLGTEHYLHATPELLAIAGRRLQRQLRYAPAPL